MPGLRIGAGTVSLVLIGGSILLIFFVVLSGVTSTTPLDKTWFLQADTSSIPNARAESQWNYFYVCGAGNSDCGKPVPDLPFGYAWVGNENNMNVPTDLAGNDKLFGKGTTSKYYWYMWRFGWVLYLIGLVVDVLAFFLALASPFSRLASAISGFVLSVALFFFSLGAALMTVTFVKARDVFNSAGMEAHIGKYAFGFTWAAWACMFLAFILLIVGVFTGKKDTTAASSSSSSRGFFRRQRSRRSTRGSFIDNEPSSRVKEDYA